MPTHCAAAAFNPPTVSDTKRKFLDNYVKPIPAIYNVVVQELLVQQHFIRHSVNYSYNEASVAAVLSPCSVCFSQCLLHLCVAVDPNQLPAGSSFVT